MRVCVCAFAGPAVWVEQESGVAGTGVGAGNVGTQLLAVTIATLVKVCPNRNKQHPVAHLMPYNEKLKKNKNKALESNYVVCACCTAFGTQRVFKKKKKSPASSNSPSSGNGFLIFLLLQ